MIILTVVRWNKECTSREEKQIVAFQGAKAAMKEVETLRKSNNLDKYSPWEIATIADTLELEEELVLKEENCRIRVFSGSFLDGIYLCDKITAVKGKFYLYRDGNYITSFPDSQTFEFEENLH